MGVKAPETEEEPPLRDIILSLTPTVFTASADLEGLLQCACETCCYDRLYLFLWFCCNVLDSCVPSSIHSLITLTRRIRNSGGWDANPGSISRNNCEGHVTSSTFES